MVFCIAQDTPRSLAWAATTNSNKLVWYVVYKFSCSYSLDNNFRFMQHETMQMGLYYRSSNYLVWA